MLPTGNELVIDGCPGYDWANNAGSGYRRYTHIHGRNGFGRGLDSTIHVESIWAQVKELKSTYKMIPSTYLLYYIREAEWKIKSKTNTYTQKLGNFFEMYNIVDSIGKD